MQPIDAVLACGPVIAVLVIEDVQDAVPLARALAAGGVRALEVTLRTPAALGAIERIAGEVENVLVGAGTVLRPADAKAAKAAGSGFAVSPGLTSDLAQAARDQGLPFLPGVATASEIIAGLELGLDRFKFFPAETSGGAPAVKAFFGPFADIRFCPTGGITPQNTSSYLALPNVVCVGGSWLAPADAVKAGDWGRIETLARAASALA
jgi:2-dehydro-3-deoxyphosphogluconate aldolase/(4S)-4-hydroxy-2-oxoglutarate aldolase